MGDSRQNEVMLELTVAGQHNSSHKQTMLLDILRRPKAGQEGAHRMMSGTAKHGSREAERLHGEER